MTQPRTYDPEIDLIAETLLNDLIVEHIDDLDGLEDWLMNAREDRQVIKDLIKFKHPPIGIREFIEGPAYMNRPGIVWPGVMDALEELNDGTHTEAVLTGAIGVAKTTAALYTQAYQVYLLSCLRNPHNEFDLDPATEITIIFQSINKELAADVDYTRFREMIAESPYFQHHFMYDRSRQSEMRFPNRIIVKPVAGHDKSAIGQNVIGGIIDEINFMAVIEKSKQSKDGEAYDQAIANYNTIAKRRDSRFSQKGWLPGMLCLVSSRNYPGQFTDVKEAEAKTNPRIYVYDKKLWELRPERYSFHEGVLSDEMVVMEGPDAPFWFDVFIGDATRKPRILEPGDVVSDTDRHLVMPVPIEHKDSFRKDIMGSLRDIGGVATTALHPFIYDTDSVSEAFATGIKSIASRTECDFKHTKLEVYPKLIRNKKAMRFAHIDLAISGDSAGVAIGHVSGFKELHRGDHFEIMPVIEFDMTLEVRPPVGGEIIFEKIRQLLYTLRKIGLPIKWVTFDSFQSTDSMQILAQNGFTVGYQSMDTDTLAYDVLKQAFYDRRVKVPTHLKPQRELIALEFDAEHKKVDHPPKGSKDVSDAMAGVIYGLTMRREIWNQHGVSLNRIPARLIQTEAKGKKAMGTVEKATENA